MFILATKVWPVITGGLDERNAKIREEIAAAEAAQKQARAALEEYEKSLAEARQEAQRMLDETRTQQAALAAELKAKADKELTEMREKAKREIETAKKTAIGELYAESVNLATQMAGKILQREVTVADQQRMLEEAARRDVEELIESRASAREYGRTSAFGLVVQRRVMTGRRDLKGQPCR